MQTFHPFIVNKEIYTYIFSIKEIQEAVNIFWVVFFQYVLIYIEILYSDPSKSR